MLDFLRIDWLSLTIPLAYLAVLVGSLATFSSLYRKRKIRTLIQRINTEPSIRYSEM